MPSVLVVYATTNGHTARVAARLGATLDGAGVTARVHDVRAIGREVSPRGYDGVSVAASVHQGRHQREIAGWVRAHHTPLALRPSALVSVSLSAADGAAEARGATRRYVDEFTEETRWSPNATACAAGALRFGDHDLPTRILMRLVARRHGQTGDLCENDEYTDWAAVDGFGRRFAAIVGRARQAA
jgi:menaquinone-dependent protoporphyrinogen oxidase